MDRLTMNMERQVGGSIASRVRSAVIPVANHAGVTGAVGLAFSHEGPSSYSPPCTRFATRWGMTIKRPARLLGPMT